MTQAGARFEPSHRVGDFVLRRWLAQGGMAELYLATPADPARAHEVVVLKRVLPQFTRSESFGRMFAREARLATMLRHPNIVEVHDDGHHQPGDCFFTMEYVHGVDLGVLLDAIRDRGGVLPLAHALTIAVAMCAGLHHAHEAHGPDGQPLGIVHRDVSPSNVLISFDGEVKVTDFGVATARAMTRLTEEGTRKGKLAYMSPEQATGETVDRRADVFAIATVLFELTTMERLFAGDNDLAIMYDILERPRPSPRERSPGYPAALEQIVMRAVSHDPSERFTSARGLQQALEGFAASVGLTLSTEALGRFVRSVVPVPIHPRDDPGLWAASVQPRSLPHAVATPAEVGGTPVSGPVGFPTGPIPGLVHGSGPSSATCSGGFPLGAVGPGASSPWTKVPPSRSGRGLRWLSAGLAVAAALVAVGVGAMVLRAQDAGAPATEPATTSPAATPRPTTSPSPSPASVPPPEPIASPLPSTEPSPVEPAAAGTESPTPRKTKKRRKKRDDAPSETAPSDPPSKKPAPTDTLLPIRE